jgi:biotin-(acetyl-CoA carboxylase) ligase
LKKGKGSRRTQLSRTARTSASIPEPIDLPPPFTLVRLRESRDAFAHAVGVAEESGAGTLVYVGRFDLAEFAVVLEPSEPLRAARRAFYVGMVALTNALRAYAPPNKEITIDWPDAIRIDGGLVGGGRLGWPSSAKEDEPPAWLVFGAMIRTVAMTEEEAGVHPLASALDQEGFGEAGAVQVTESFARHLMLAIDIWQADGFESVAREFLSRLPRERRITRRIEGNGDLIAHRIDTEETERWELEKALAAPSWLDVKLGGPRL